jgi:hypothetical protein
VTTELYEHSRKKESNIYQSTTVYNLFSSQLIHQLVYHTFIFVVASTSTTGHGITAKRRKSEKRGVRWMEENEHGVFRFLTDGALISISTSTLVTTIRRSQRSDSAKRRERTYFR